VAPTNNAYYNVPTAYRERARERLAEKERLGTIEPATSAPEGISGMSLVPKEVRMKLKGSRVYSKLDIKCAFYHLELDRESS
jgi:hypothetical protein